MSKKYVVIHDLEDFPLKNKIMRGASQEEVHQADLSFVSSVKKKQDVQESKRLNY
jgi:hypothetical protein